MATKLARSSAAVLLCMVTAGCGDTAFDDSSRATGDSRRVCVETLLTDRDLSDAVEAVADALCAASTAPASQMLERTISPEDLQQLILMSCAMGSPEPDLQSSTEEVEIQLKSRALDDEALAQRWEDSGLETRYTTDAQGYISVEFNPQKVANLGRLQLSVAEVLYEHRVELCP